MYDAAGLVIALMQALVLPGGLTVWQVFEFIMIAIPTAGLLTYFYQHWRSH